MSEFIHPEAILQRQKNIDEIMKPLLENNPQAHNHSRMVAGYATMLAEFSCLDLTSGITSETCDKAYVSGLLHDLGKGNLQWVNFLKGRPAITDEDKAMLACHTQLGSEQLESLIGLGKLDEEQLEISRFIAMYHHTTDKYKGESPLANSRKLLKDPEVKRKYQGIRNWEELADIFMIIKIVDAFDSCSNNMWRKIPIPDEGYVRPISIVAPDIRLQFEGEAKDPTKERFDKKFLSAFDEFVAHMIQYGELMLEPERKIKAPEVFSKPL